MDQPAVDERLRAQFEQLRVTAALDGFSQAFPGARLAILVSDARGVMRFARWRGLSGAYRTAVDGHSFWPQNDPAPRPVVVRDLDSDLEMAPFREVARAARRLRYDLLVLTHRLGLRGRGGTP